MIPRILIRHLAGSQAHRIEQLALDGVDELLIGRGPAAHVAFDERLDDTVSRRHARIRIERGQQLRFKLADLGSTNGIRVNGKDIAGERELGPADIVELSPGGPAFSIALEPGDAPMAPAATPQAVNRDMTVPFWRVRRPVLLAIFFAAVGFGALALIGRAPPVIATEHPPALQATVIVPAPAPSASLFAPPVAPPLEASIVYLEARWRLFDIATGKPIFQKVLTRRGQRLPCFVALADGRIVPWLTTEDEEHTNIAIGGTSGGSGFIADAAGGIVAGKALAAGWQKRFPVTAEGQRWGALFKVQDSPSHDAPSTIIDLTAAGQPASWVPAAGGTLFRARTPVPLGPSGANFEGRNERLTVRLPNGRDRIAARLIRVFTDADLAEIRIDADRPLPAVDLAQGAAIEQGEKVTALGYPATDGVADTPGLVSSDSRISGLLPASLVALDPAAPDHPGDAVIAGPDGRMLGFAPAPMADGGTSRLAYPASLLSALLERP